MYSPMRDKYQAGDVSLSVREVLAALLQGFYSGQYLSNAAGVYGGAAGK
jgi:hypothetical protein